MRKRLRELREQQLGEELDEAHQRGQAQEELRICRLIAGGGIGPRRRNFKMIAACTPTAEQWKTDMAKPAKDGGMSAQEISEDEFITNASENDQAGQPSYQDLEEGAEDYQRICKALRRTKRRRASVQWSVPVEIWAILLSTRPDTTERTVGLGAGDPLQDLPHLRRWVIGVLE